MALDETSAAGGTIEYARGSHRWEVAPPIRRFHAPDDYREDFRDGRGPGRLRARDRPGRGAGRRRRLPPRPHLARLRPQPRRPPAPLAGQPLHPAEARFHPTEVSYVYSRYKRVGDEAMDESFFPVLWTEAGGRTAMADLLIESIPTPASVPVDPIGGIRYTCLIAGRRECRSWQGSINGSEGGPGRGTIAPRHHDRTTWQPHRHRHLAFDDRHRRRVRLRTDAGHPFLLDLPEARVLRDGDRLALDDGTLILVRVASEAVLDIHAADPVALARIAWHLGHRRTPTQILPGALRIRADQVLLHLLTAHLGATVTPATAQFDPEGGGYGHGHEY